jgi:sialate O-acetylesterase
MKKIWTLILLFVVIGLKAEVKLPPLFSSNMVLQQGMEIPVWGWAFPGEKVTVTLNKTGVSVKTGKDGKWALKLPVMNYGGPYTLTVKGKNQVTFENVMIGEVWVCSGQSNMEFQLMNANNAEAEIAASNHPEIRLFTVKRRISQTPQNNLEEGEWVECSTATSPRFSAVAYFFGRSIAEKLKVTVGLINVSWGGTIAETWTSDDMIAKNPDFEKQMAQLKKIDLNDYVRTIEKEVKERVGEFSTVDLGMQGDKPIWAAPDFNDSQWKTMPLPGYIEQNGLEGVDGIIWFRREIEIKPGEENKPATLYLAKINDSDHTFLNGTLVGATNQMADKSRVYTVPAGILKPGRNVLTVQVEDVGGVCGIYGDTATLHLQIDKQKIPLSGSWKYKIGMVKFNFALSPNSYPTLLFNGMINPLIPYGIKGAIWYQGEGNASRAKQYQRVFPDLITDWRNHWKQGDFPFLFVQLANFMKADSVPVESAWAELREAQSKTLALPNTGMAVIIDVGDALDIHPKDKQTVGNRLALNALNKVYHQNVEFSGPVLKDMKVAGQKILLTFDHCGTGLKAKDKYCYLKGFTMAGEDKIFYWAAAEITGENTVEVSCPQVKNPVAVRYAWANNPDDANLYNSDNLPASSFRTDSWKGITE